MKTFGPAFILFLIQRYECLSDVIKFERKLNLDGYACPLSEKLFSVVVSEDNPIGCSSVCATAPTCQSVYYRTDTGQCDGCTGIYTHISEENLELSSGTQYYLKQECPAGWTRWQLSCYKTTNTRQSFVKGKTECAHDQGHAVYIESIYENNFLTQLYSDRVDDLLFIGVVYSASTASWTYDGTQVPAFTNFAGPEGYNTDEYCTTFWKDYGDKWADVHCDSLAVTLCEINL